MALLCALLLESKQRESGLFKWAAGPLASDDEGFHRLGGLSCIRSQRLTLSPSPQLYLETRNLSL